MSWETVWECLFVWVEYLFGWDAIGWLDGICFYDWMDWICMSLHFWEPLFWTLPPTWTQYVEAYGHPLKGQRKINMKVIFDIDLRPDCLFQWFLLAHPQKHWQRWTEPILTHCACRFIKVGVSPQPQFDIFQHSPGSKSKCICLFLSQSIFKANVMFKQFLVLSQLPLWIGGDTSSQDCWLLASKGSKMLGFRNLSYSQNIHVWYIWSRFAVRYHPPPPPTWYGPKTCVLQHSAWKRCICSVFCMVGCWCGPQPCKFVGFLQPTFRKRVICNVSASTSWSSAAAPSSISVSNYHIILNLLLTVFSLGTGLISVYILCLSNFLLECLVFRNWSNLKFS